MAVRVSDEVRVTVSVWVRARVRVWVRGSVRRVGWTVDCESCEKCKE